MSGVIDVICMACGELKSKHTKRLGGMDCPEKQREGDHDKEFWGFN